MSLQFIFGNSGSGKSWTLCQTIIRESQAHPMLHYLVIVPEQFTLQTQREFVLQHPDHGILNIEVLSFGRLAHRVFEEVGNDQRTVLTETGKNLMLRRVLEQVKEELTILGGKLGNPGYVSRIKSILSELMQYEITDFDLAELIDKTEDKPLLNAKLKDLRVIYRAFLDFERERFMKPEEQMQVLCRAAEKSALLKKSVLAFDGFAGFTPAQLDVLGVLLDICPKLYVSVTIDAREPFFGEIREHELFAPSRRLIRDVSARADQSMIEEPLVLGKEGKLPRFSKDGALLHLEQNLFRARRSCYRGNFDELSIHSCKNPVEEIHFAAREISRLVREGYRYRDIAIICGDLGVYSAYIKNVFPLYHIPAFVDETRHLLLNPCLEFVRGALSLVLTDFSSESVFRFLRTGMAKLEPPAVDELENYVIASGIRGRSKWMKEWTYLPRGMKPEELSRCNEWRNELMELLGGFSEGMRANHPLSFFAKKLYELLVSCEIQQQLKDRELALKNAGDAETASGYSQTWPIVMDLMDEMVDLLGQEVMDCREFSDILDAGLSEAKVGIIPPGIDQLLVGDIRRSRLSDVKVLFFLGLNDGWVPAREDSGGIVSENEREILMDAGADLAPTQRQNSYLQRFYLYQNLTKPQDFLYLSYSAGDMDGKVLRPSYLVSELMRLFPDLSITEEKDAGTSLTQISSRENGMLVLLNGFEDIREGKVSAAWRELCRNYLKDDNYRGRVQRLLRAAAIGPEDSSIDPDTAKALYFDSDKGDAVTASVTRLEEFAGCPFSHFASYGLSLKERQEYGLEATDLGTIFHRAMELFSKGMLRDRRDFASCPYEEMAGRMDHAVDLAADDYNNGILHDSARQAYTIRRLKRILRRTVWAMREQTRAGEFRPAGFELSFDNAADLDAVQLKLGQNRSWRLKGRIDRVDTAQKGDKLYVKVVDYKSGAAKFDPVEFYYGLQLQLPVYLSAAMEMEKKRQPDKKIVPAGIFYMEMQDPVLDRTDDPKKAKEALLKSMRPNGLINGDGQIIRLYDSEISGDSLVIPAKLNKDGKMSASQSLVTTDQLSSITGYSSKLMRKMGEEILDGKIGAKPFADKNKDACRYCIYADVCGFDRRISGRSEKRSPEIDADEVLERMKGGIV